MAARMSETPPITLLIAAVPYIFLILRLVKRCPKNVLFLRHTCPFYYNSDIHLNNVSQSRIVGAYYFSTPSYVFEA